MASKRITYQSNRAKTSLESQLMSRVMADKAIAAGVINNSDEKKRNTGSFFMPVPRSKRKPTDLGQSVKLPSSSTVNSHQLSTPI